MIHGSVDALRLAEAMQTLMARYEILRSSFPRVEGLEYPVQVVDDRDPSSFVWETSACEPKCVRLRWRTTPLQADSFSFELLVAELAVLYGGQSGSAVEPLQYADYAEWANQMLEEPDDPGGPAFWRGTSKRSLNSPSDQTRLAYVQEGLATPTCGRADLLATWLLLLAHRFHEPHRLLVRTDGRAHQELQNTVGPLERWLPLQFELTFDETFNALSGRVGSMLAEVREHENYFGCVEELGSLGFGYEERRRHCANGVEFELLESWRESEGMELKLIVIRTEDVLHARLEYDEQRWDEAEAKRLIRQYTELLEHCIAHRESPLRELTQPRTVWAHGRGVCRDERRETIVERVERTAREQPGVSAVSGETAHWSYRELASRTRQVSAAVRAWTGGAREAKVGLYAERSPEAVAGLLGIWGAGATAVLLEPGGPHERLASQLRQVKLSALVIGAGLNVPSATPQIDLRGESPVWEGKGDGLLVEVSREQLAYVLFTSGTTGNPKAVEVPHGALEAYADSLRKRLGTTGGESWESVTTLAADLGYTSLLGALCCGGHLVLRSQEQAIDWHEVGGCDYLKITPGHLEALLLAAAEPQQVLPRKGLLLGGEAWDWTLWNRLNQLQPALKVWNHYGPTETAIGVTLNEVRQVPAPRPPLGAALEHARLYVLDETGEASWDGVAGELWIGGTSVARGYAAQPRLTADRFRPDPWAGEPGARMYGTGDRVRRRADGGYEFLGRLDRQLKIHGIRIEPAEVEAALRRHPAVAQAAVVPSLTNQIPSLRAVVVPSQDTAGSLYRLLCAERTAASEGLELAELPNGLRIAQQNASMTKFVYHEIFKQQTYLNCGITLQDNPVVVDIGANIGLFTLSIAQRRPAARIFAFEPVPQTFRVLAWNTCVWAPQAVIENVGLGAKADSVVFTHYPDFSGASGRYADPQRDAASMVALAMAQTAAGASDESDAPFIERALEGRWRSVSVLCQLRTLSHILVKYDIEYIDLLKIDAERSEIDILQGIADDDWPKIRQIVLEAHSDRLRRDAESLLIAHGYQVHVRSAPSQSSTDVSLLYAIRADKVTDEPREAPEQQRWDSRKVLIQEVQEFLRGWLPKAVLPISMSVQPALPITANGKLDLAAIAANGQFDSGEQPYTEPETLVEKAIAFVWSELLEKPRIGAHDNFLALGGNSLLAIQCVSRLRTIFASEIPLRLMFDTPHLSGLASAIQILQNSPERVARAAELFLEIEAMSPEEVRAALAESGKTCH
jgi:amino acid adenylation domain-containing protein/FkbM family methyltransferase